MKKMLSLILALMLLALCPAMAENAVQTQLLSSPDGSYSIEVPADYVPMNAEAMMNLLKTEAMMELLAQSMGLENASQLQMYFEALEASNLLLVYSDDMSGNLNGQAVPYSLTMDQLVALKTMMDEVLIEQYISMGVAEEDIQVMDIQEIGGRRWYGMKLVMADAPVMTMMTIENGIQYVLTFTEIDELVALSILESFKLTTVAE